MKDVQITRQPVLRRKVSIIQGHRMVANRYYRPVKCSVCQQFIIGSMAMQCHECRLMCHRRCRTGINGACQSSHETKHVWKVGGGLIPAWCIHCGFMLPFLGGRKSSAVLCCTGCSQMMHAGCTKLACMPCGKPNYTLLPRSPSPERNSLDFQQGSIHDYELRVVLGRGNFGKVDLRFPRCSWLGIRTANWLP